MPSGAVPTAPPPSPQPGSAWPHQPRPGTEPERQSLAPVLLCPSFRCLPQATSLTQNRGHGPLPWTAPL